MAKDEKKESIIEAARKRFNHFGVGKTTMNEIADDLSLSKASLYYYFPDKLNLYAAVLQKIIETEQIDKEVLLKKDPFAALSAYLDYRTQFIIKHYNILEYLKSVRTGLPKELEDVFNSARIHEVKNITTVIAHGVENKKLKAQEPKRVAELLLDCLDGLRLSILSARGNFFPDKKQFQDLSKREKELVAIFIKGLS
jgi:TetR/AcrR family transcriptional repressor of mexJK operon